MNRDSLRGRRYDEGDVNRRKVEIWEKFPLGEISKIADIPVNTAPMFWVEESRAHAKSQVYTEEILFPIKRAAQSGKQFEQTLS